MADLSTALADGGCLVGSAGSTPSTDLKYVLAGRLSRYYARLGSGDIVGSKSLEEIQLVTAKEALSVVGRVQRILGTGATNADSQPPLVGTRDLAELRTLLSIVFKWGVDPLLSKVTSGWQSSKISTGGPRIIDLTTMPEDHKLLSSMVSSLMDLLFPSDSQGRILQTLITTTILNRHVGDVLGPCIALGWLPRSLISDSTPALDSLRPLTVRLLNFLPPSQTITALGGILSSTLPSLPHVHKTCSSLLSKQLVRPQGVRGLCAAVFGEEQTSTDDTPLEKLEHVARVFTTVPAIMKPEEYFHAVIPRIIGLLSPQELSAYKRAAAFTISRMLPDTFAYQVLTSKIIFSFLHHPLQVVLEDPRGKPNSEELISVSDPGLQPAPSTALHTLITLVSNMEPSPTSISALLSPIAPVLYSLLHKMDMVKTSDPNLKESLHGLLVTWGKITGTSEGINILWSILDEGEGEGEWVINVDGQIYRSKKSEQSSPLSLLTPEDLRQADETDGLDLDTNLLNLYPDPVHFVRFLKQINRPDISSDVFVKLLEAYHHQKLKAENDPLRTLLYLQLIMQMQTQLSDGKTSSNILYKPTHLLSFIKHVLEPAQPTLRKTDMGHNDGSTGLRLDSLRLFPVDDGLSESDSDDDTPGSDVVAADDEMLETSVNLLLSILEANEDLSARTAPVLNDIFLLLEPLAHGSSPTLSPLAREARMVMTARLASTSTRATSQGLVEDNAQEIYQKALKLLQDPILPVRAHGLLLLRQLVTPAKNRDAKRAKLNDHALVPAVLSIFLQSIQDDDSYIFLNAVQGLAAMVDMFGTDVLKRLLKEYTEGLDGVGSTTLAQRDIDVRVRLGEALQLVIRRSGDALAVYVDILVPTLFNILRSRHIPTILRTSSLSLLAGCMNTSQLAMLPYVVDLADAMIDLLQVETEPADVRSTAARDGDQERPTMDSQPTSKHSKFPPLRRSALHFLSILIREITKQTYNSSSARSPVSNVFVERAKITLVYVASTDQDMVVRVMAREADEGLDQMQQAILGL